MVDDYMEIGKEQGNIQNEKKSIFKRKNFSTSETVLLVIMSLLIGFCIGELIPNNNISIEKLESEETNNIYLKEFIKNYNYILDNYYESINEGDLINGAISGMMESLDDPYSVYLDEDESNNFSITLDGSFKGLGVQILKDEETGYMLITSVFKNSPASLAGLQAGDLIISINSTQAKDITAAEFSTLIRESAEDKFELTLLRDEKELKVTASKNTVVLNSVLSKTFEVNNKKIGYIYIGIFANNTYEQFKTELENLEAEKIDSLIIDVRDNTGGHLTAVDGILDLFLNSEQIMYQFLQSGVITKTTGTGNENKTYEIVLLGNENSASASEVLIAGLSENLNSKLIGKKTYGKGTVQELVNLSDGTQYKITIKKWLTPKGNWINDTEGIMPDVEVELEDKYYDTYEDEDDSQLQKALEYLSK